MQSHITAATQMAPVFAAITIEIPDGNGGRTARTVIRDGRTVYVRNSGEPFQQAMSATYPSATDAANRAAFEALLLLVDF